MTTQSNDIPRLSVRDVAERLNLSDRFVYDLINAGKLQHYVFGGSPNRRGSIRISEAGLADFVAASMIHKPADNDCRSREKTVDIVPQQNVSLALNRIMRKGHHA